MRASISLLSAFAGLSTLFSIASASVVATPRSQERSIEYVIKPKVFIISMFEPEGDVWYGIPEFDLLARNITVPGFSPLYPDAHCTENGDVCELITGESGTSHQESESKSTADIQQKSTLLSPLPPSCAALNSILRPPTSSSLVSLVSTQRSRPSARSPLLAMRFKSLCSTSLTLARYQEISRPATFLKALLYQMSTHNRMSGEGRLVQRTFAKKLQDLRYRGV